MAVEIVTKFTIATEEGIDALLYLTQSIAREKFLPLLPWEEVENYLSENYSEKALMVEVNSMSNQWLVVYADKKPAGFARITSKGKRPETVVQKRVIRLADLGVLQDFNDPAILKSLLDKCLSVCQSYEAVWITEYEKNPYLSFFESAGFSRQDEKNDLYELPLPSVCLIKTP